MRVVSTAQMPHSTERGGDLTTLGPGGWTHRTLEEVHEGVDVGLDEEVVERRIGVADDSMARSGEMKLGLHGGNLSPSLRARNRGLA